MATAVFYPKVSDKRYRSKVQSIVESLIRDILYCNIYILIKEYYIEIELRKSRLFHWLRE